MKDSGVASRLEQLTHGEGVALQDMHLPTLHHILLDSNLEQCGGAAALPQNLCGWLHPSS